MDEAGILTSALRADVTSDDRDRDDASLFQHCPTGGIGLSDGAEEAAENGFLLDGEAGVFEDGARFLALAPHDIGNSDLFGAFGHRVGDGVAAVQNRSLIGLLRDDLSFGDRVGEGFGRRPSASMALFAASALIPPSEGTVRGSRPLDSTTSTAVSWGTDVPDATDWEMTCPCGTSSE